LANFYLYTPYTDLEFLPVIGRIIDYGTVYTATTTRLYAGEGSAGSGYSVILDGTNLTGSAARATRVSLYYKNSPVASLDSISLSYSDIERYYYQAPESVWSDLTSGNDKIYGSSGNDVLLGGAGDDQIAGFGGNDVLYGNTGNDYLLGYEGNDVLYGGQGRDDIYGNQGDDLIYGNFGEDTLWGGQGSDTIYGGQDRDYIYGNFQDDVIYGNLGDDVITGGQNNDFIFGNEGNDWMDGNRDNDTLVGGAGADSFVFSGGEDLFRDFSLGEGDKIILRNGDQYSLSNSGNGMNIGVGANIAYVEGYSTQTFDANAAFRYV
jgi:Ca2+-binding RTX toxin-like protein